MPRPQKNRSFASFALLFFRKNSNYVKMRKFFFLFFLPLCAFGATEPILISLGVGCFNVSGTHKRYVFQAEYKGKNFWYALRPQAGAFITELKGTYFYGGLAYDLFFGKYCVLTPSFSPGVYFRGQDKSLGFPIEFRSCIELAGVFNKGMRLGVEAYHLSNAHLSRRNPGVNVVAVFYSFPLKFN